MKLYSKVYEGQLRVGNTILEFKDGVAEIEDEVGEEILNEGYANISSTQEEIVAPSDEKLSAEFKELAQNYENEIVRLKGIVVAKQSTILTLEKEVENWKAEYLKLSKDPTAPKIDAKENDDKTENEAKIVEELKAEFNSLTKENIVALLCEKIEGFDAASVRTLKKDELIEYAIKNL